MGVLFEARFAGLALTGHLPTAEMLALVGFDARATGAKGGDG